MGNCYLQDIYHEIITCTCKNNVCELTFLVTRIAVVIIYQGWRNPEWTKFFSAFFGKVVSGSCKTD